MRLAIIADIHSNLPALEAVLKDIETIGVDEIVVAGDVINGGPFPHEVVTLLEDRGLPVLLGNHEQYVLECLHPDTAERYPKSRWGSLYWTTDQLENRQLERIRAWPVALERAGMLIVHGSPQDLRGGILPETPDSVVAERFSAVQQRWVITAHTHIAFVRQWQHLTLINPGSVGMPLDGNPAASYVLLTLTEAGFIVQHRRVMYDTTLIEKATRQRGLLEIGGPIAYLFMQETLTGRPLVVEYLEQIESAMQTGLSEDEAISRVPLPL